MHHRVMATLDPPRKLKDGTQVWWVRFHLGGQRDAEKMNERFTDLLLAKKFKADVELAGGHYPPGYLPKVGYVNEATMAKALALADGAQAPPEPEYQPVLFRDLAEDHIAGLSGIEERTKYDYRREVRNHMLETFGDLDVKDPAALTAKHVAAWVNWLADGVPDPETDDKWIRKPLRPKTITNLHGLLFAIMRSAVEAEPPLRATNPCHKTTLPRADDAGVEDDSEEMVYFTSEEFEILHNLADPVVKDVLYVAVGTGMRFSEFTALQKRDLHLNVASPYLRVLRAWKRQPDYTFLLRNTKTVAGTRSIPLSASMVAILRRLTENKRELDFVFVNKAGDPWRHANFFNRYWEPLLYKAVRCEEHREADHARGLRMRKLTGEWIVPCHCPGTLEKVGGVHALRHTCVSWLIAANVPMMAIADQLGHDDSRTTERKYGHLVPELDNRRSNAIEAALGAIPFRAGQKPAPALEARDFLDLTAEQLADQLDTARPLLLHSLLDAAWGFATLDSSLPAMLGDLSHAERVQRMSFFPELGIFDPEAEERAARAARAAALVLRRLGNVCINYCTRPVPGGDVCGAALDPNGICRSQAHYRPAY